MLTAWAALLPMVTTQGKYTHNYKEVTLDLTAQTQGTAGAVAGGRSPSSPTRRCSSSSSSRSPRQMAALQQPNPIIQKGEQLDFVLVGHGAADRAVRLPGAAGGASAPRTRDAPTSTSPRRRCSSPPRRPSTPRRRRRAGRRAHARRRGRAEDARQRAGAARGRRGQPRRGDARRAGAGARRSRRCASRRTRRRRPIARSAPS